MSKFNEISWNVSEDTYRQDPALSYSTLAKYERGGFNSISTLADKIESPSLLFGSCVDALITGGKEEFDSRFYVADIPDLPDKVKMIVDHLFTSFEDIYSSLDEIPDDNIITEANIVDFQSNWTTPKRIEKIKAIGSKYYEIKYLAKNKTIVTCSMAQDIVHSFNALKQSNSTKEFFAVNNPFNSNIERFYQLKFKTTLNGINYRCMFDELYINHTNKTIQPIDLKTSSHIEAEFHKSFLQWTYSIQARLYARILKECIKGTEFEDYTILPYKFIVVNKETLTPLVWDFEDTFTEGTLVYGKNKQIEMRDPEDIGKELAYYLNEVPKVPIGININTSNSLTEWLNKL